jgi:glycosyltransferase involved in cell wall biosynthesis/peptidoglycan/xylan/chitin deacetylase (PgdA/CDA1 family)
VSRLRGILWRGVALAAYYSGLVSLVSLWRRRIHRRGWTILAYHRIGSGNPGGGPELVQAERFRRHLRYLRQWYEILPVGEAFERWRSGRPAPRPLLSVTFDDGYRDNVTAALPILREEGCRATLYACVEAVRDGKPPWPHRLGLDLLRAGRSLAEVSRLQAVARTVPDPQREAICAEASIGAPEKKCAAVEMMRPEDLKEWHRCGMEVGSHTATHRILARLSCEERIKELVESRRWLEETLGVPVRHLAYPNGRAGDWDAATLRDVREAGYISAVTTVEGINSRSMTEALALRRVSVGNDPIPVFAARVSGLFAAGRLWLERRSKRNGSVRLRVPPAAAGGADGARLGVLRPLRIAFIGGRGVGGAYSGIERYYEEVGSRLVARGHRVIAYCRSHFTPCVRAIRGVEVRRLPTLRSKHLETFVHTLAATLDVCFRRVDIVQYHALGSSPFAWLPRLFGKKTIVSVRGLDWQRAKWGWFARVFLRACEITSVYAPSATVVVSEALGRHFGERFDRPVHYIPNGVGRLEAAPAGEIAARWGLVRRRYFLYAGRLSPEKRLEDLLEAHRALEDDVDLVLAGGSSYSTRYIERLKEIASPRVKFTGFVTGRTLQELYSNALAFVIPSQIEGLSVAILEALGYGLPVIASDLPESRELIRECGGFLVPVGDATALGKTLKRLADDPDLAQRIGERARIQVLRAFNWDRIAAETETLYLKIVSGPDANQASTLSRASAA